MQRVELGRSGLRVSRIGFGGCPLGGHGWGHDVDARDGIAAVRAAYERGIDFFDTADVYGLGQSELRLAEALGPRRHEVVIASKCGVRWDDQGRTWKELRPAYLLQALEASLRRLGVERIPLYYVHWPDGVTPIEDAVGALRRAQEAGKIGAIGVSNFSAEQLRRAAAVTPIAAVQLEYSLVRRELAAALLPTAAALGIPFVTWGSLAQGLLTGKYSSASTFGADDHRHRYTSFHGERFRRNLDGVAQLSAVAQRLGATPAQVAIRWLLDAPNVACVLVGAKRVGQVDDNAQAMAVQLPPPERQLLEAAATGPSAAEPAVRAVGRDAA